MAGVPDSLLAPLLMSVNGHPELIESYHTVPNEGNAVALSAGYYLSNNKTPFIYLQNSGLGNAVNPLTSLISENVYDIPMVLIIGWRGEPDLLDEPQHNLMGKITLDLLRLMEISTIQLDSSTTSSQLDIFLTGINPRKAIVVKKNSFEDVMKPVFTNNYTINRYEAITAIVKRFNNSFFVATTGKASRELYDIREKLFMIHSFDFLNVGAMGHTSSVALSLAISNPNRQIICLDGDGAIIMQMGILGKIAIENPLNFLHIILDNEAHESVGGFENSSPDIDFGAVLKACGYQKVYTVSKIEELISTIVSIEPLGGLTAIVLKIKISSNELLGRPKISPVEQKLSFMEKLTNG